MCFFSLCSLFDWLSLLDEEEDDPEDDPLDSGDESLSELELEEEEESLPERAFEVLMCFSFLIFRTFFEALWLLS